METWKAIAGYEGLYEVSDQGRVRSLNHRKSRILKTQKRYDGYLQAHLCKNSKMKNFLVHRLVAQAFCPNPDPIHFDQVNHLDEVKTNNVASNLEWCDVKYNNNYGTHNDKVAKALINYPKKSKEVQKFDKQGNLLATYPSTMEAGRVTGICQSSIVMCCHGKLKSAGGYIWRYA